MIAISLLVGNDHDLNGVQGIGLEKALRFVQSFSEDEILNQFASIPVSNSVVVVVVVMYLKIMLSDNVVLS